MANISSVISNIRNIMRQDRGISGDAQRLEQLGWMLFLKIMDDKDQELELIKEDYISAIPEALQWRVWAVDKEGITGEELIKFIENDLFPTLKTLVKKNPSQRSALIQEVFDGNNNYMKSGYEMRKVINKLNEVDFNKSEDKHLFGDLYESILLELRDAGNKGEYYTPRAVTQLMTQMTRPKLGEHVLDPACGTGGFLTAAIDYIREKDVHTVDDEQKLQKSITGWELKPVAYVLGLTNLILHEIDVPDYHYIDSLKKEYNSIGKKDRVDVILANPPFGASIAEGVETNFPATYRCKESADLFVILMIQLLKAKGRAAIVLPDGSITGDGVKARIREKLLTECNLHTIVRLPQSTFFPATVSTNLLFFEKGSPTKEIWYYEHKLPEGQKSYSKTKPIQFNEFKPLIDWWHDRKETDLAWKVKIEDLKNWDLDIKNPTQNIVEHGDPTELYALYSKSNTKIKSLIHDIAKETINDNQTVNTILDKDISLFKNVEVVKLLKQSILQEAIQGKLTADWRTENPDTEPASKLLKRIQAEKQKLIDEKKIRKEKPLPKINAEEIPFDLPDGWVWCRLGELGFTQTGTTPAKNDSSNYGDFIPFLQPSNITENGLNFECIALSEDGLSKGRLIKKHSNFMVCIGGSSGKTCFSEVDVSCNQQINTITSYHDIDYNLNPKPHFPSVHSCVILSKNSSINYLKSS
ncbi:MAG: N-6 DNA methylase [Candidatus Marinimicrobia bacterium]|jgi:type I restriction enzyme M protein|nr:N-6 DNA methylase [Candidatus Neomarinimicrobiota bacterium]